MSQRPNLSEAERACLLKLAREVIARGTVSSAAVEPEEARLTSALRAHRACFVTLHQHGVLRGCIGNLTPKEPLFRAVMENAYGAAFRDMRFAPVAANEVGELNIEISVLSEPRPLEAKLPDDVLRALRPGVDGVVLSAEGRTATFLPQVWEKLPQPADFLAALSRKAGLEPDGWRTADACLLTYQVESFAAKP